MAFTPIIIPQPPTVPDTPLPPISFTPLAFSIDGALISEAEDSDDGNVITATEKQAVKRWVCELPFTDDKPTKYLSKLFPQGQAYPGTQIEYRGLVVFGYSEGVRTSSAGQPTWRAEVIYRGADELATLGWVAEGEFSEEQEHVGRDYADVFAQDENGNNIRVGNPIGHSVYVPTEPTDPLGSYSAASSTGVNLTLKRTGAFKITGFDRYRSTHRFSLVRVLPILPFRSIRNVEKYLWTVNSGVWWTYQPGELAFSNFGWREVFGADPSKPQTTRQLEVRLQFAANPEKWSPRYEVQTYTDEQGFESEITFDPGVGDTNLVVTKIIPYLSSNFQSIFNILNVLAPKA